MDVSHKRELYNGFGESLARAMEFAGVLAVFGLGGRWLDSELGTSPAFLVGLVLFACAGLGVRSYYAYKAQMEAIDADAPWGRR